MGITDIWRRLFSRWSQQTWDDILARLPKPPPTMMERTARRASDEYRRRQDEAGSTIGVVGDQPMVELDGDDLPPQVREFFERQTKIALGLPPDSSQEDVIRELDRRRSAAQDASADDIDLGDMTWEEWSEEADEYRRDGWSFCYFRIRSGARGELAEVTAGIVHGAFGVYVRDFRICRSDMDDSIIGELWSLTHLSSGLSVGLFQSMDDACRAAEATLVRMPEWDRRASDMRGGAPAADADKARVVDLNRRTIDMWGTIGIHPISPDLLHAHGGPNGGIMLTVFERRSDGAPASDRTRLS